MSDEVYLRRAVVDNPLDDTPRLMLADWLEEHGGQWGAIRAEFIRTQIELAYTTAETVVHGTLFVATSGVHVVDVPADVVRPGIVYRVKYPSREGPKELHRVSPTQIIPYANTVPAFDRVTFVGADSHDLGDHYRELRSRESSMRVQYDNDVLFGTGVDWARTGIRGTGRGFIVSVTVLLHHAVEILPTVFDRHPIAYVATSTSHFWPPQWGPREFAGWRLWPYTGMGGVRYVPEPIRPYLAEAAARVGSIASECEYGVMCRDRPTADKVMAEALGAFGRAEALKLRS